MLCRLFRKIFSNSELKILILLIIAICILKYFKITCIFYKITSVPCPTCGMTRAVESLFKGDFEKYCEYNVMALPVFVAFLLILFNRYLGRCKKFFTVFGIGILVINFLYYIFG